jgi:rfaE bifunctional protein nucleotidyltransferase chain/domain
MSFRQKIYTRAELSALCDRLRAEGRRIVFTNGCFDILHIGHVALLHEARALGDFLIVGVNSDASVRRLKGPSRPVNPQDARAAVLGALADVDAVCIFEEDTPIPLLEVVRPHVHVKGGDYQADDLPEAATVRAAGGEIVIVPLQEGYSTTRTLAKAAAQEQVTSCTLIIPARFGSTRFPGKPLAELGGRTVIEHVVLAGLKSRVERPVLVATDDERIAAVVRNNFAPEEADVVMTSAECHTGTDRIAEAVRQRLDVGDTARKVVINVQGDEPFINPEHVNALMDAMDSDATLQMGTLATPIHDPAHNDNPNIVKVVKDGRGRAL